METVDIVLLMDHPEPVITWICFSTRFSQILVTSLVDLHQYITPNWTKTDVRQSCDILVRPNLVAVVISYSHLSKTMPPIFGITQQCRKYQAPKILLMSNNYCYKGESKH